MYNVNIGHLSVISGNIKIIIALLISPNIIITFFFIAIS